MQSGLVDRMVVWLRKLEYPRNQGLVDIMGGEINPYQNVGDEL